MTRAIGAKMYHGESVLVRAFDHPGGTWVEVEFKLWGAVTVPVKPNRTGKFRRMSGRKGKVHVTLELRDDASLWAVLSKPELPLPPRSRGGGDEGYRPMTEETEPANEAPAYSEDLDRMLPGLVDAVSRDEYRFANCATATDLAIHREDVVAAVLRTGGNYANMAKLLSRTRTSVVNFVRSHEDIAKFRNDVFESKVDAIEEMAEELALAGDKTMIKFMLTTKGKNRGFSTRVEHTGKDGSAVQVETRPPRERMEAFLNRAKERLDGPTSGIEEEEAPVTGGEAREGEPGGQG